MCLNVGAFGLDRLNTRYSVSNLLHFFIGCKGETFRKVEAFKVAIYLDLCCSKWMSICSLVSPVHMSKVRKIWGRWGM